MHGSARERPHLERRPEATAYNVDDLLQHVSDGRIRVPAFQRPMRWRERDRVDLLDSIYRGFPIGTLLLWRHRAKPECVKLGDFQKEVPERADALWVIDGQQRLATLASALLVAPIVGERALLFDVVKTEFHYARLRGESQGVAAGSGERTTVDLELPELFDEERLIELLARHQASLSRELRARAVECGKRLRQYRIPAYVVDTGDASEEAAEAVLRDVFERTNRTGRKLDEVDVFAALYASRTDTERFDLDRVVHAVAATGFGRIGSETVLVALRAIMRVPIDKDYRLDRRDAPSAVLRTEAALLRTIAFLRDDAGIPHVALNPYQLPVVVLAKFFDRFPEPSVRSRILLRRWFWRGALAGALSGVSASRQKHVDAIVDDEDSSVQQLLHLIRPDSSSADPRFDVFRLRTARSSLELCALWRLLPKDLVTGGAVDPATLFAPSKPPRFPTIVDRSDDPLAASVANILFHPPIRGASTAKLLAEAAPDVLASHGVPESARHLLQQGDAEGALRMRAESLSKLLGDYFHACAEFDADDSPSLDSLVIGDES